MAGKASSIGLDKSYPGCTPCPRLPCRPPLLRLQQGVNISNDVVHIKHLLHLFVLFSHQRLFAQFPPHSLPQRPTLSAKSQTGSRHKLGHPLTEIFVQKCRKNKVVMDVSAEFIHGWPVLGGCLCIKVYWRLAYDSYQYRLPRCSFQLRPVQTKHPRLLPSLQNK